MGKLYEAGDGVPPDAASAAKWYRLSAEAGLPEAEFLLGVCYADGEGAPQDNAQAYKWIALAAVHGDKNAATFRDTLAKKLSPDQRSKAQQLVNAALDTPPKN